MRHTTDTPIVMGGCLRVGELLKAYEEELLDLAPNASERRVMTVLILCLGVMNP